MIKVSKILSQISLLVVLSGCGQGNKSDIGHFSLNDIEDIKTRQYAVEGQALYENYCANCHQQNGTGLGRLIPPLKNSDFMMADEGRTIKIIKAGLKGEIIVNGLNYNQPMPGNENLTDLEIAEIATYIYTVFGDSERLITPKDVKKYLGE